MNEVLRERMLRKLETLPDERAYQVLDYVEFLESKYAVRAPAASVFQRFAESVEDTMRAGRVSAATIAETMNLMSRAMGVLSGALAAGKSVASDVMTAATRPPGQPPSGAPGGIASCRRRTAYRRRLMADSIWQMAAPCAGNSPRAWSCHQRSAISSAAQRPIEERQ